MTRDLSDQDVAEFRDFISRCKVPAASSDYRPPGWQHPRGVGVASPSMELRYFNAMPRLLDARDRCRELLKRIEWSGEFDEMQACPECKALKEVYGEPGKHEPGCELDAMMGPR